MGIRIIWTELKIVDFDIKHEELTSLLDITPSHAFNKGDLLTFKNKKIKERVAEYNYWELKSDSNLKFEDEGDYEEMFESHINNILQKLVPVKDKFLEITKDDKAWIQMIIESYEWHSYIGLSRKVLKQLAEFNLYIHFDLSYMGNPEIEEAEK